MKLGEIDHALQDAGLSPRGAFRPGAGAVSHAGVPARPPAAGTGLIARAGGGNAVRSSALLHYFMPMTRSSESGPAPRAMRYSSSPAQDRCVGHASG